MHERFRLSDEVVLRDEHPSNARYLRCMGFRIGVVGATGATGQITLALLA